ncbi:MAG: GAF domain-containing protein [Phycisphaeraceae bacterium]|nr:GAF domain-containing protein [Phycisphaeraceae bacterium]MCW5763196.1 GAF domain-containing protein [Phycisphaeraceae bacterium]
MHAARDYAAIALKDAPRDRSPLMRAAADVLWNALAPTGVSWVGFYLKDATSDTMVLGPCRDKPACSPIGLHGACGQSWRNEQSLVVHDVRLLGDGYIACDPRDLSEVVVPLFGADGACWGVLDADSFEVSAFSERDAQELALLMVRIGLSDRTPAHATRVV